ncbi:hypothetical protein [Escherichia coli]|uniref:hypothetical protein n=1 Tax=Escherichia coli TaxID=562 RepID=UPI00117DDB66|nr:hypothetical protein [Escherichia coli]
MDVLVSWCAYRKKNEVNTEKSAVTIEIDGDHQLIKAEEACDHSYAYSSIIARGTAKIVQDAKEIKAWYGLEHTTGYRRKRVSLS